MSLAVALCVLGFAGSFLRWVRWSIMTLNVDRSGWASAAGIVAGLAFLLLGAWLVWMRGELTSKARAVAIGLAGAVAFAATLTFLLGGRGGAPQVRIDAPPIPGARRSAATAAVTGATGPGVFLALMSAVGLIVVSALEGRARRTDDRPEDVSLSDAGQA